MTKEPIRKLYEEVQRILFLLLILEIASKQRDERQRDDKK